CRPAPSPAAAPRAPGARRRRRRDPWPARARVRSRGRSARRARRPGSSRRTDRARHRSAKGSWLARRSTRAVHPSFSSPRLAFEVRHPGHARRAAEGRHCRVCEQAGRATNVPKRAPIFDLGCADFDRDFPACASAARQPPDSRPTYDARMRRVKGLLAAVVGSIGAAFIYGLIRLFGRVCRPADVGWLVGPLGGTTIGERVYEETAAGEALTLVRHAREGGLIPSFDVLARAGFDPARVHPKIRDFYQRTHAFRLDTWATTYFPARLALWALVTTI